MHTAWPCLGLAIERPWLTLGGPLMPVLAEMDVLHVPSTLQL